MKPEKEYIIDHMFDNKRQYQIPVYQRNYDWKKTNCLELFNDVTSAYEREQSHFLGTIVQVQQDEENGIKHFIIIDGQQRMTSIYLMLKALYDSCGTNDGAIKDELEGLLFNTSSKKEYAPDEKNKLKLKPIKSDNEQFSYLMSDQIKKMDKSSNIYINYEYFKTLIAEYLDKDHQIKNIKKGLEYLVVVMISLQEPEDEPQVVFDRINSTGEDLTLADKIRNYLLMTDRDMETLYENFWLPVENLVGRSKINDYFSNYLNFKLPEVNDKNAYQQFKKIADKSSHAEILKDVKRYSKYFNVLIRNDEVNYSKQINNLLEGYRLLKQSTIFPFLFSVFDDFENNIINEEMLEELLSFFLNYTLRRLITGIPSNSLRGLYKTLYKRIFDDETKRTPENYLNSIYSFMATITSTKDIVPNDTTFKDHLMNENIFKNRNMCRFILSILENGLSYVKEKVTVDEEISIEHIMPQNDQNEEWMKEIGPNYPFVYQKYLHTLGNLSLTGYNSELSDKPFLEKVKLIKEKSKFTYLNEDVVNQTHWNEQTIKKRAERLSSKLVAEFKLPEAFLKSVPVRNSESTKYSVYDCPDMTFFSPTEFIFMGEKKDISSAAEMLIELCNFLRELDPEKTESLAKEDFKLQDSNKPFMSYNPEILNAPRELGNSGIYIETKKSFNSITRSIKKLLDVYEVSYDDFIFYAEKSN